EIPLDFKEDIFDDEVQRNEAIPLSGEEIALVLAAKALCLREDHEYGREDFCLITGFWFGKVNLDPDEKDHFEFRMRVFPKIENLKGKHLLELVNKDVKFAKLDDEDVVRVCLLLALDFVFMGHELRHVVLKPIVNLVDDFYKWDALPWENIRGHSLKRGITTLLYGVWRISLIQSIGGVNMRMRSPMVLHEVTRSILVLRSATKGSSKGKSIHTCVRTEVRHEVHVRTEVSRVHFKEDVHVPAVENKDIQERDEILKTVKEQKQMILDMQFRLNSVVEKLNPGPSDADHLDKTGNLSKNAPDCGLDQQSMGGLDDEYESVAVDGLISLWSQDAGHLSKVQDDVNVNSVVKEEIVKDDVNVDSLVKEDIEKDDVNVDSLVKEDIKKDGVHINSVVKDVEQIENETLPCQKFPGKAYLSPYIQPPSTEVKCRKRRREIKLEKASKLLLGRMELKLNCYHGKRLSHNIPLEVDDPISFALAYHERLIEFYWKYKMLPE
nr:phospholipase-like protein [Tanacetum cinerariifolium]